MKKVITYGTFDQLHYGHINLLKRAKQLGDYLIVGVTTDNFDIGRGKMSVRQTLMERIQAVVNTGLADLVIPEEYIGQKVDDINKYDVDIFAIGSDWEGYFDYLKSLCEVVYLERTKGVSSTEIRAKNRLNIGIIGYSPMVKKFIKECTCINELEVKGIYFAGKEENIDIRVYNELNQFYNDVEAVYIITPPENRYFYVKKSLEQQKHVLCESPIALKRQEAEELFELARLKKRVLFEGIKTAYAIAFNRLKALVKSEWIGKTVSIDVTCTSLSKDIKNEWGSFESWGSIALLPILSILGTEYIKKDIIIKETEDKKDLFTGINFIYSDAIATMKVAKGAKSEGDLVISGTKGYIYVPAPWWKTEYFELRYEDPNNNRRYYYKLEGEGIRYELSAFTNSILFERKNLYLEKDVTLQISQLMEDFFAGKDTYYLR